MLTITSFEETNNPDYKLSLAGINIFDKNESKLSCIQLLTIINTKFKFVIIPTVKKLHVLFLD